MGQGYCEEVDHRYGQLEGHGGQVEEQDDDDDGRRQRGAQRLAEANGTTVKTTADASLAW